MEAFYQDPNKPSRSMRQISKLKLKKEIKSIRPIWGKIKKSSKDNEYRVIGAVPVSDEKGVVTGGIREGDGDEGAAEDSDGAETTGGLVEGERGEIVKASNLILDLEDVGEVLSGRDGAGCSINTVFV